MAAVIGTVGEFDDKSDSWSNYIDRLEQFYVANDINAPQAGQADKRKAILLSCVGAKTYSLLCNLVQPQKPGEKTFEEIVSIVKNHHNPKPSEIVQRFKFNTRSRRPEETIRTFVAELRSLSEHCNFEALDSMLRDRLVCGVNNKRIQSKLLSEKTLTFKSALDISLAMEAADVNLQTLAQAQAGDTISEELHYVKSNKTSSNTVKADTSSGGSPKNYKCYRCGNNSHSAANCGHKTSKCHSCSKIGHIAPVCRSNKRYNSSFNSGFRPRQVNSLQNDQYQQGVSEGDVSDEDCFKLFTLPTRGASRATLPAGFTAMLEVNGRMVDFQIDTGASLTVMTKNNFDKLFSSLPLQTSKKKLKTYTGEVVSVHGEVVVSVRAKDQEKELSLLVVEGTGPPLLGRDWLNLLGLDWPSMCRLHYTDTSDKLETILGEHSAVFSDTPGCLRSHKVKIHLRPEATPKFCKARQPPYAMRQRIEEELDRLQRDGIIKPVEFSDWATPIVPVIKKDNSVRICGDYKTTLNGAIQTDNHPIPLVEDLSQALAGGQKFSKLDFSQAYTQLELDDDSKPLTTINTHKGLFSYERLCFGISAAPGIFQRTVENLFVPVPNSVNYIDDLYVTGQNDDEHLKNLNQILTICEEQGLSIKRDKCQFLKDEVEFLGFKLSKAGLQPLENKVEAIKKMEAPTDKKLLKSFLGTINYYAKFVSNLATVLTPLYHLLHKDVPWEWGKDQKLAFNQAKSALSSATLLAQFDPNKETILTCDASPVGLGAILSQKDENGINPVAFASRTLNDAERNYAQIDREALSIIFAVKKWHKYISGRPFKVITDHKPLLGLFGENKAIPEHASARVQRWALILAAHSYSLEYKPGSTNEADVLSRLPVHKGQRQTTQTPKEIQELFQLIEKTPLDYKQIAQETIKDETLKQVYNKVLTGWAGESNEALKPFHTRKDELSIEKGCILWGVRVIIPVTLREQVLSLLHESHVGMARMKAQARAWVWWPKIDADIEQNVRLCYTCQLHSNQSPKAPLFPWEWPEEPWSRVHLDFAGPYLGKMFLIIVDAHSKWVDIKIMNKITAQDTILELRDVFATLGLCSEIVTDNGPTFTSQEFRTFLGKNGIKHITVSPWHPSSNGLAERYVQDFKKFMTKNPSGSIKERVVRFLTKSRSLPHSTTGLSPAELMLGRKMKTHLDLLHPQLQERVQKKQSQQKKCHDTSSQHRDIIVGDNVFAQNFSSRGERWIYGVICEKTGPYSFKIKTISHGIIRRHLDQIRKTVTEGPGSESEREDRGDLTAHRPQEEPEIREILPIEVEKVILSPQKETVQNKDPGSNPRENDKPVSPREATPVSAPRRSLRQVILPDRLNLYLGCGTTKEWIGTLV